MPSKIWYDYKGDSMKRKLIMIILLIFISLVSLTACKQKETKSNEKNESEEKIVQEDIKEGTIDGYKFKDSNG